MGSVGVWVAWAECVRGWRRSKFGMGNVGATGPKNIWVGRNFGISQKQCSLRSVPFHYIVSVPYMYFFRS